jgi:hypothetical protein
MAASSWRWASDELGGSVRTVFSLISFGRVGERPNVTQSNVRLLILIVSAHRSSPL